MNKEDIDKLLKTPIWDLNLTVRAYNCLLSNDIRTIEDLIKWTEYDLVRTPNLGKKSFKEIQTALLRYNLSVGMNIEKLKLDLSSMLKWEIINNEGNAQTLRMQVPGGWVLRHKEYDNPSSTALTYIPDIGHIWRHIV